MLKLMLMRLKQKLKQKQFHACDESWFAGVVVPTRLHYCREV